MTIFFVSFSNELQPPVLCYEAGLMHFAPAAHLSTMDVLGSKAKNQMKAWSQSEPRFEFVTVRLLIIKSLSHSISVCHQNQNHISTLKD